MTEIPLELLPRLCPFCGERTIIGHGQRRKQAHDQRHRQIWIRRGRCRPCQKTFTVLPDWSPPSGHYSLHCRQQAWELLRQADGTWERSIPDVAVAGMELGFGVRLWSALDSAHWAFPWPRGER